MKMIPQQELPRKRFATDSMLGKLAKWLRVLGFDARCESIHHSARLEDHLGRGRLVVTRRRKWRGRKGVLFLESDDPGEQLREVVERADLTPAEARFLNRCIRCNVALEETDREGVRGAIPDYVLQTHARFFQCPLCRRIYWPGSHPERMKQRLLEMLNWSF